MIILGIGSNLGDRIHNIKQAIELTKKYLFLEEPILSPFYESAALLPDKAPDSWNTPFLNMAIMGKTTLHPDVALIQLKRIEKELGRQERAVWAPREIDIDILAYGQIIVHQPHLVIPHPLLHTRSFVLFPLADIAPHWVHPHLHKPPLH